MTSVGQQTVIREIVDGLGHPLIDGDGHLIEVREAFVRFCAGKGREGLLEDPVARGLLVPGREGERFPDLAERRRLHLHKPHRWFTPADSLDYASVAMPGLMHERLPETGFDFAVVYPTYGLHIAHIPGDESRRGLCRLYNEMVAEDFAPYRDRLSPVGVLPLNTPEEGVEGLEHGLSLGLRAFVIPSYVWRPIPAFAGAPEEYRSRLRRMDHFGVDSDYDYDPFWKRVEELNVPVAAHLSGAGLADHVSPSNSLFSAGHFAATAEMLAKSLFLGGVLRRFPRLRVGLLEGGVAVGVRLLGDLVGRFDKRGPAGIQTLDPGRIDTREVSRLAQEYSPRLAGIEEGLLIPPLAAEEGGANDFEASGAGGAADIVRQFCSGLYWGCEGDDPLVGVAFDTRVNPCGTEVPCFVGSDIGHWDVPSFDHPLREAYEQLEHGVLTRSQFKAFTFDNAVRFYAGDRPDFFAGTTVEASARSLLEPR